MPAIPRNESFTQVCMWPACVVGADNAAKFEADMLQHLEVRVQYLEEVITKPDHGDYSPDAGGRNDLVFAVHKDDTMKFALARLQFGIRWVEDVLDNEARHAMEDGHPGYSIYPDHLPEYRTW